MAVEWGIAAKQDVHDDAERPQVASLIVAVDNVADESINNFGRHEFGTAHRSKKFRRRDGRVEVRVELDARTEIEITDLDRRQTVGIDAKDIFRLEVSMSNALLMQELQAGSQITKHQTGFVFGEVNASLNVRQQWATQNLFKDQIEAIFLLEKFDQLDDVGMSLAVVERFHFFKNAIAAMPRHFFNYLHIHEKTANSNTHKKIRFQLSLLENTTHVKDMGVNNQFCSFFFFSSSNAHKCKITLRKIYLDCVLDISPNVDTGLNRGVSALPQKLARQFVELYLLFF